MTKGSRIDFVPDGKGGKHFVPADPRHVHAPLRAMRYNTIMATWVTAGSLSAALRVAGYRPNHMNSVKKRLLQFDVREEVQRRREVLLRKVELSQEGVLIELARIGFSNITDIASWQGGELTLADSSMIAPDALAAISEISVDADGKMKIKMHDKKGALVDLGKFMGMTQAADLEALLAKANGREVEAAKNAQMDRRELARRAAMLMKTGRSAALPAPPEERTK